VLVSRAGLLKSVRRKSLRGTIDLVVLVHRRHRDAALSIDPTIVALASGWLCVLFARHRGWRRPIGTSA